MRYRYPHTLILCLISSRIFPSSTPHLEGKNKFWLQVYLAKKHSNHQSPTFCTCANYDFIDSSFSWFCGSNFCWVSRICLGSLLNYSLMPFFITSPINSYSWFCFFIFFTLHPQDFNIFLQNYFLQWLKNDCHFFSNIMLDLIQYFYD